MPPIPQFTVGIISGCFAPATSLYRNLLIAAHATTDIDKTLIAVSPDWYNKIRMNTWSPLEWGPLGFRERLQGAPLSERYNAIRNILQPYDVVFGTTSEEKSSRRQLFADQNRLAKCYYPQATRLIRIVWLNTFLDMLRRGRVEEAVDAYNIHRAQTHPCVDNPPNWWHTVEPLEWAVHIPKTSRFGITADELQEKVAKIQPTPIIHILQDIEY
jgi:hypothetical protein